MRTCFRAQDGYALPSSGGMRALALACPHPGLRLAARDLAFRDEFGVGGEAHAVGPWDYTRFSDEPGQPLHDASLVDTIVIHNLVYGESLVYVGGANGSVITISQTHW